jgi:DNA-directed RNA polymerase subunit M/transcription elongation factor TFIIS
VTKVLILPTQKISDKSLDFTYAENQQLEYRILKKLKLLILSFKNEMIILTNMTNIEFHISDKERKKTKKKLLEHFRESDCDTIEEGFYDFTKQFCENNKVYMSMATLIYHDHVQNLIFNCQQNHDTMKKIISKIEKKKFNAYNLAFLRPDELDKDCWMKIILRKNTTEEKLNNLPSVEWKPCRMCKSVNYYYYQLQTRSIDEPMTMFYVCQKCNKTYKING